MTRLFILWLLSWPSVDHSHLVLENFNWTERFSKLYIFFDVSDQIQVLTAKIVIRKSDHIIIAHCTTVTLTAGTHLEICPSTCSDCCEDKVSFYFPMRGRKSFERKLLFKAAINTVHLNKVWPQAERQAWTWNLPCAFLIQSKETSVSNRNTSVILRQMNLCQNNKIRTTKQSLFLQLW